MNKKIKGLNRTMVYSFLIGLILGGIIIGWVDANAKTPLFSSASRMAPYGWTTCVDENGQTYLCPVGTSGYGGTTSGDDTGTIPGGHRSGNTNTQTPTNTGRTTTR